VLTDYSMPSGCTLRSCSGCCVKVSAGGCALNYIYLVGVSSCSVLCTSSDGRCVLNFALWV
jgi:hypothetical protein